MQKQFSIRDFSMAFALLVIWGVFTLLNEAFLSPRNLTMLFIELSITATLALGMLLVLLPGHIDLSVGSGVGLIGGVASVGVFRHHYPAPVAMATGGIVAIAVWTCMGAIISKQKVPSFILTLGGLLIFKGIFWMVIQNATVPVSEGGESNLYMMLTTYYLPTHAGWTLAGLALFAIVIMKLHAKKMRTSFGFAVEDGEMTFLKLFVVGQMMLLVIIVLNQFRGIPLALVLLCAITLFVYLLTRHTPFGRHLLAIGDNEEAAMLSGVPVHRTIIAAYAILGGIVAITGFMQTAYAGASTTTVGDLMELDAIAACVIGGTSLKGGRGNVLGVLFGALIMASLLNGMTLLAVPPELKFIVRGAVLTLAVWLDVALSRKAGTAG